MAALAINAVAIVAMGATTDLGHQLILRFVSGGASALILVFASSLVLDHPTAASEGLSSVHFAGVGFGIVISAATVAFLSCYGANWSWLWFVNGAICILLLVGVATLVADDRVVPDPGALKPRDGQPLKIGLLAVAYGLFGFGYVITATFLVAIVRRSPAIAPLEPWIWILFGISAIPSVVFWSHLSSQWGTLNTFAIACLIEAVGVAASLIEAAFVGAACGGLPGGNVYGTDSPRADRGPQVLGR
jgi:MFS family permease